jgi:medium-chain acyl-[acyl-carrier-protein] hydrolase
VTLKSSVNPWIMYSRTTASERLRLFCFSHAGGAASSYRTWKESLPPAIGVYPIQLPGRENRINERPYTSLPSLLEALVKVLAQYSDLPFAFFGHSLGAVLSYELTRQLRRENRTGPVHLFLSGRGAPHLPDNQPPIYHLPEAEFLQELRRYNGIPDQVLENAELVQLILPILRTDFEISETYTYTSEPPIECPITALGGIEDDTVTREELAAWSEHTHRPLRLQMFPGDHFYLNKCRNEILQLISRELSPLVR